MTFTEVSSQTDLDYDLVPAELIPPATIAKLSCLKRKLRGSGLKAWSF